MLVKIATGKITQDGNIKIFIKNNTFNFDIKGKFIIHKGKTFDISVDVTEEAVKKYRKIIEEHQSKIAEIETDIQEITG